MEHRVDGGWRARVHTEQDLHVPLLIGSRWLFVRVVLFFMEEEENGKQSRQVILYPAKRGSNLGQPLFCRDEK